MVLVLGPVYITYDPWLQAPVACSLSCVVGKHQQFTFNLTYSTTIIYSLQIN
jgi:hypothetical protein